MSAQKKCFNNCPKCGAGENEIDWGGYEWSGDSASQNAICQKCHCEFTEVYTYSYTEYVQSVN